MLGSRINEPADSSLLKASKMAPVAAPSCGTKQKSEGSLLAPALLSGPYTMNVEPSLPSLGVQRLLGEGGLAEWEQAGGADY